MRRMWYAIWPMLAVAGANGLVIGALIFFLQIHQVISHQQGELIGTLLVIPSAGWMAFSKNNFETRLNNFDPKRSTR